MVANASADGAASVTMIEIAAVHRQGRTDEYGLVLNDGLYSVLGYDVLETYSLHVSPLPAHIIKNTDSAILNGHVPTWPCLAITLSSGAQRIVRGQIHITTRYNRTVEPMYLSKGAYRAAITICSTARMAICVPMAASLSPRPPEAIGVKANRGNLTQPIVR